MTGPDRGAPRRACLLVLGLFGPVLPSVAVRDLLADLDISHSACRSALHRLRQDGSVQSHRDGRHAHFGLTAKGADEADELLRRITDDPPLVPEGRWLEVVYRTADPRASRALREWLERRGFGTLTPGVWLHRVDHREALRRRFGHPDGLHLLLCEPDDDVAVDLWDLVAIRARWEALRVPSVPAGATADDHLRILVGAALTVLAVDDGDPQLPEDVLGTWHPRGRTIRATRHLLHAGLGPAREAMAARAADAVAVDA